MSYCRQALTYNPKNNFQATLLPGRAYLEKFDGEAFKYFDLVTTMNPTFAEGFFYKGKAILYLGNNYKLAVENFDKAIELDSNNAETYFLRGDAQARLKNFSQAIEDFTKAAEINFYEELGEIYFALGDYEKAVENFSKHIELHDYAVEAYYLRGKSYFEQKNFVKALADFEKYVSTIYELMSEDCHFSESETNFEEAKNFCDLCKKNLEG